MTADNHLPILSSLPDVEVAWLTDINAARLERIAGAFGVRRAPPEPASWPAVDLLLLATPYGARGAWHETLAGRVRGVYVEKPFARTVAEHEAACAAFPPGAIAVGFQRRSSSTVAAMRALCDKSAFGPLRAVRIEHGHPRVTTGGRYLGKSGVAAGGVLIEVGIHAVDAALHASGAREVAFERIAMEREDGLDVHTEARGRLVGPDGDAAFELLVTQLGHTTMTTTFTFRDAVVSYDPFAAGPPRLELGGEVPAIDLVAPAPRVETSAQMVARHWQAFCRSVASGEPGVASAETTILTTRCMQLLYEGSS